MSSGIFYSAANGDDGHWEGANFSNNLYNLNIGLVVATSYNAFVRFSNVTIPQGSSITSAFIRFTAHSSLSGTIVNENIYFNNADNAIAPTTAGEANALVLTGASAWNGIGAWVKDSSYDSPDIASILQPVIDRPGFSSGNAVQIVLKDNGSSSYRYAYSYKNVTYIPELHVTWIAPIHINSNITIPSMQAVGYTGIYSAPLIPMMQAEGFTGIHSSLSIPMTRANATLSDNMVHIESSVTIPSMTAEITQAKQIWGDVTAPMMTAEITERETVLGNVAIPMMTAELTSGVHADLEVTAPMLTAEGTFSNQCEVKIPMMAVEIEGQVGRVISSDVSVLMMTVEITGKTEHLVNCDVSVPMMRIAANLMTGKIITGAATLPMMTASLTSYEEITGDINISVPIMEAYMIATAERAECAVLRYVEPVL